MWRPLIACVLTGLLATCASDTAPAPAPGAAQATPTPAAARATEAAATSAPSRLVVRDLTAEFEAIRVRRDAPALVGALVVGADVLATAATGVRERGKPELVTLADKFHLGSCTKSMTGTLIGTLVEAGKMSWAMRLGDVFPERVKGRDPRWATITVEQLLAHRSGVPSDLSVDNLWGKLWERRGTPTAQRLQLLDGVLAHPPVSDPGTTFLYSNAGIAIAGAMAEQITGEAWEDLMQKRLFAPLGMTSCGFGAPGTAETLDQPRGHKADGVCIGIGPQADNPSAIGPAGTAHCAIGDWARYISLHVQGARGVEGLLLKPETFKQLHHPFTSASPGSYAAGWGVDTRPWAGGRVLTHNGSNNLWFCVVWIAPEKNFAVMAATNQGGGAMDTACDEAVQALIHDFQQHEGARRPR